MDNPVAPPVAWGTGPDVAREALRAARAAAATRRRAAAPGGRRWRAGTARRRGWSGPGPDERDPQPLGRAVSRLVLARGWTDRLAVGTLFASWSELVGAEVAQHAEPVRLRDGELTVRASSTAWATQLRLLQRQLLARIAAGLGPELVRRMRVLGPDVPSWRHGQRTVRGRGPRDTYG